MQVAQRGTSSTSSGYHTVDRFENLIANVGVTPTQSQQSTSTSDTPYQNGFSKFLRISIPSAGTANTGAELQIRHKIESQDILNSGWNYKSSSAFLTLSFWFRCSTNQTFYVYFYNDNSGKALVLEFTASGNNTWTKITKQIKGDSTLVFNADNSEGLAISFYAYHGTAYTNNRSLNTWGSYSGTNFSPDMATTWLTAGASTFDITGVQLEVDHTGSGVATDFEHRSYSQELELSKRYFFILGKDANGNTTQLSMPFINEAPSNTAGYINFRFHPEMRATPTATIGTGLQLGQPQQDMSSHTVSAFSGLSPTGSYYFQYNNQTGSTGSTNSYIRIGSSSTSYAEFSAEL
jgi:hypothetical protein